MTRTASGLLILWMLTWGARPVDAQFADPCDVTCALTLGAVGFVFATGSTTAVGRARGGFHTARQGMVTWGAGFLTATAAGVALSGEGGRQRRAVYSAAAGAASGALTGLLVEAIGDSTPTTRLVATLVGAGAGVLVGGTVGALTWDGAPPSAGPRSAMVVRIPLGR